MTLAAALQAHKAAPRFGPRCKICLALDCLDAKDQAALVAAMADESYTSVAISNAMRAEGYDISPQSVSRHRRGDCRGV
jgi:hypothetical protein